MEFFSFSGAVATFSLGVNFAGLVLKTHVQSKGYRRAKQETRKCGGGVLFALTLVNFIV